MSIFEHALEKNAKAAVKKKTAFFIAGMQYLTVMLRKFPLLCLMSFNISTA